MKLKKPPIFYWFLYLINFSVEKLFVYFAVKCFDFEIEDFFVFNFIVIYKGKGNSIEGS